MFILVHLESGAILLFFNHIIAFKGPLFSTVLYALLVSNTELKTTIIIINLSQKKIWINLEGFHEFLVLRQKNKKPKIF